MFPENKEKSLEMLFRQASKSFLVFDIPGELLSLNRSNHVPNLPQVSFQSGQVWCNESVVILTYVIVTLMFFLGFLFFHTLVLSSSMVWFTPLLPHPPLPFFSWEKQSIHHLDLSDIFFLINNTGNNFFFLFCRRCSTYCLAYTNEYCNCCCTRTILLA